MPNFVAAARERFTSFSAGASGLRTFPSAVVQKRGYHLIAVRSRHVPELNCVILTWPQLEKSASNRALIPKAYICCPMHVASSLANFETPDHGLVEGDLHL
jgi:hypothetical protein